MKGIVFWLKSLRLHKYSWVFTNLTYEQMLNLTEERLQVMGITKELETEVMNGGDLLMALKKLKSVLQSPLQVTSGEDLPSQFVKVMGKVCTQLLMLRQPSEENLTLFSGLCERAESLEAFNLEQRRRLALWRTQLTRGNNISIPTQRHAAPSNNTRQQTGQSQYYLPVSSGLTYSQQVYGQKSSSYPNVQTNQVIGAHRNSLGNLNPNVNHATNITPTIVHLPKTDLPGNHYQFPQVTNNGGGHYSAIQGDGLRANDQLGVSFCDVVA
ncbi:smaug [Carabus blaptoides fortunei]